MPNYRVLVTRDVTESAWIEVEADDPDDADQTALERANDPDVSYERDEIGSFGQPYITSNAEEADDA